MGLHMPELIIVLVVAMLIFGPKKLPEMSSAIGKGIKALRKGMHEISDPDDQELSAPTPKDTLSDPNNEVSSQAKASSMKKAAPEKRAD